MLIPAAHVHWARCPGGTAVLNLRSGQWSIFEGDGARIWDAVTLRGSIAGLAEEFAVPVGRDIAATRTAIDAYLVQLRAMGLLTDATARRSRRWWWSR
ncbi:hypothetical protein [Streptomyces sp. BP-8]|uniref:PqqD family protein n=1 Tax=Streptomyces sirii TaxID=3127701 RepID=A0ABZ2QKF5_9ACTN